MLLRQVADDDSTYLHAWESSGSGIRTDVYNFADTSSFGTITGITLYYRVKASLSRDVRPICYVNSTYYYGSAYACTSSWSTQNYVWSTNPSGGHLKKFLFFFVAKAFAGGN